MHKSLGMRLDLSSGLSSIKSYSETSSIDHSKLIHCFPFPACTIFYELHYMHMFIHYFVADSTVVIYSTDTVACDCNVFELFTPSLLKASGN